MPASMGDVAIASIAAVPATIAALAGFTAARRAGKTSARMEAVEQQVKSPNGQTTGETVEEIRKEITTLRADQAGFRESVRASRQLTAEVRTQISENRAALVKLHDRIVEMYGMGIQHMEDDNDRFEQVFNELERRRWQ